MSQELGRVDPGSASPPAAPWAPPGATDDPDPRRGGLDRAVGGMPRRPVGGGPAGSRGTSVPEPGGIPLRPLDLGDILDGTFGTIRRNRAAVLGLSALLVGLQQLLVVGAQVLAGDIPTATGFASGGTSLQVLGGVGAVVGLVLSAVVGAVLTGMIVVIVSEDVLGRRTGAGEVWRRVRPRFWALLGAAVIAGVLPFLGLILFVVPGVILWGTWALTTPALILERLGPIQAVRRSWRLAWPDFWRVWGIRALSVLLGWLMQNLVVIPFVVLGALLATALGARDGDSLPLLALGLIVLGSIAGGTIVEPFLAGVVALLYVDRRMRAEGLDIALQLRMRRTRRVGAGPERGDAGPSGPPGAVLPATAGGGAP
jgi:hypothetical protein